VRGDRVKIETLGQPAGRPAPGFRGRKSLWRMIKHLEEIQGGESISLAEGVYAALLGPSYETPAEIRYLRTIGADLVGMSTAPEAIAANHMGARVLTIS